MKLTEWERQDYKALKKELDPLFILDKVQGLTIAVCTCKGSQFSKIATAYCSPGDKFNKKRGKYIALARIFDGGGILVKTSSVAAVFDAIEYGY